MKTIYCLELEQGRFYVGQTPAGRLKNRYAEHKYYHGSEWTRRYPPKRILHSYDVPDKSEDEAEDQAVCEMMMKHGRNSCRGGTFNTRYDVGRRGPNWLKGVFKQNWGKILAAG